MITLTDFFCGAGGSSTGAAAAMRGRGRVVMAANHWRRAIETHQTNHPDTDHDLANLQATHPSRYPRTNIAWISPSCTSHSIAKGKQRKSLGQLDLWGNDGVDPDEERSRATMREVVEFTAYHLYDIVIVENVIDIHHWQHFDAWQKAMVDLGYEYKALYLNARFFGVPQSRDRIYIVFWRRTMRAPDLDFRPLATCAAHGEVRAVQTWKKAAWGRYERQYTYRCPRCGAQVQPPHTPAAAAIDWSLPIERIADRAKPLRAKTLARIEAGLRKFAQQHAPITTFISSYYGSGQHSSVDQSLQTITTHDRHGLVCAPFLIPYANSRGPARPVTSTLHTLSTANIVGLVVPPDEIDWQRAVAESGFRMLQPDELKRAMSFPDAYIILGNKSEQVRQIGNAVCCNVAEWIVARCADALEKA